MKNTRALPSLPAVRLTMAILLMLVAYALSGCTSEPPGPLEMDVYLDPDIPIVVREGDSFVLSLPDNPDSGYQWDAEFDEAVFSLESDTLVFAEDRECEVCAWGDYRFVFMATEEGESVIVTTLRRPLEADDIALQHHFNVTVTRR
ncbi:MAG: protease inhibitor I42 family protein [Dehalococcoidia bacterium]|nr:protease inhibitor I42 family protein [Dehalococcoidia bacterium]